MKYDNSFQNLRAFVVLGVIVLGLGACGGNVKKDVSEQQENAILRVVSTEEFLPVDSYDKEGVKLEYVPVVNPYAVQDSRLNKDSVAAYIEARRAFKANGYKKAKGILENLTKQDKELSGPWVMLGDIAYEQKFLDDAIANYKKSLEINASNINAYLRLARTLRELGQFIPSQNTYAKALGVWKDFPEAHLNLAILYDIYMNEPLKAQQHMEAYQFLAERENPQVAEWLAEIRRRTGVSYSIKAGAPTEPSSLSVAGEVE